MHARILRRGALTLAVLLAPAVLQAQGTKAVSADDIALRNYTLTMDNLHKLRQTMLNLRTWMMAHPEAADSVDASNDEDDSNATLADQIRNIDKQPAIKQAILEAGFTPREYVMTTMTYMQAAMQSAVAQYVKNKPVKIPANMNPANAAFYSSHQAEIAALELNKVMGDEGSEP